MRYYKVLGLFGYIVVWISHSVLRGANKNSYVIGEAGLSLLLVDSFQVGPPPVRRRTH